MQPKQGVKKALKKGHKKDDKKREQQTPHIFLKKATKTGDKNIAKKVNYKK